jgi:G6PDH family F420-dependent oxidoreductase
MGFMLGHEQFTIPKLLEFGIAAEEAGFGLLATSDHFQPWQANEGHAGEAWVTFGALGQRTHRAWMGPTVTCPTFRYNPAVVAEAFASLSWLTPGRIFLGIGSGEALNEQSAVGSWPAWPERSERLIEATDVIRKLWTGQQIDHKGKFFTVNAKLYDPPAKPIPLLMAANGPKAMRRAGQYGDGLITDPKTWKQYKPEFEGAARAAGKDPAQMPVLVELFVVVGDEDDAKTSAELWRFIPKAFKTYYNVRDPQDIQDRARAETSAAKGVRRLAGQHESRGARESGHRTISKRREHREYPFRPGRPEARHRFLRRERVAQTESRVKRRSPQDSMHNRKGTSFV